MAPSFRRIAVFLVLASTISLGSAQLAADNSNPLYGVAYGVTGNCPTYEAVLADLRIIKTFTNRVRIYSLIDCNAGELTLRAVNQLGMKVFFGIQPAPDGPFAAEKAEIQRLNQTYGFDNVLGISVGSEALYRGDMTAEQLSAKILDVKGLVQVALGAKHVPIGTADVFYMFNDTIINAVDVIMMNAFPYWEGVNVTAAVNEMFDHIASVQVRAQGKPVMVGETGWPTSGDVNKLSIPDMNSMQTYLNDFVCRANANGVQYYWFEAFDEPAKASAMERSFGLFTSNRVRKPGFVLNCTHIATSPAAPSATA